MYIFGFLSSLDLLFKGIYKFKKMAVRIFKTEEHKS